MKEDRSPFEQVVEAMADRLINYGGWRGDRLSAQRAMTQVLRTAQATGLLQLVEERPEKPMAPPEYGEPPLGEPWPEDEVDMAGHHPEGEPSEEAVEAAMPTALASLPWIDVTNDEIREALKRVVRDIARAVYAIDHPQDR